MTRAEACLIAFLVSLPLTVVGVAVATAPRGTDEPFRLEIPCLQAERRMIPINGERVPMTWTEYREHTAEARERERRAWEEYSRVADGMPRAPDADASNVEHLAYDIRLDQWDSVHGEEFSRRLTEYTDARVPFFMDFPLEGE